jgi:hypothetical protein
MRHNIPPIIIILTMVLIAAGGCDSKKQTWSHSWWKVTFETPIEFHGPVEIGVGAVSFMYPAANEHGQAGLEITLVSIPGDLQESLNHETDEIIEFIKGSFLGTTAPFDESIEREFLGSTALGGRQTISIPRQGLLELYIFPLSDGDMMALALTQHADTPMETAREVMDMIASTLEERKD